MFNYTFAVLFCVLFSVHEINATMFCPVHVLKSLIRCLLDTKIQPFLEMNGLSMNTFSQRLQCANKADCTPLIPDKNIRLVKNFAECMTTLSLSLSLGQGIKNDQRCNMILLTVGRTRNIKSSEIK